MFAELAAHPKVFIFEFLPIRYSSGRILLGYAPTESTDSDSDSFNFPRYGKEDKEREGLGHREGKAIRTLKKFLILKISKKLL